MQCMKIFAYKYFSTLLKHINNNMNTCYILFNTSYDSTNLVKRNKINIQIGASRLNV